MHRSERFKRGDFFSREARHWGWPTAVVAAGLISSASIASGLTLLVIDSVAGWITMTFGIALLAVGAGINIAKHPFGLGRRAADDLIARLRITTDRAGIGFWDRDLRTGTLAWDDAMHRIYGTDPSSVTPSSALWARLVHPEDIEQTASLFTRAIQGEADFETAFRIVRPDGVTRWVRTSATVIRDGNGAAVRVMGANWDVTELAETERRLRNTATRLSLAMSAGQIGLWDVSLDPSDDGLASQRATCDETLHTMLGYEPGELDTPATSWHSICHPEDLETMRSRCREYLRSERDGYNWDYRVRAKSGEWVWVHDAGEVVERDQMGRPTRMVGVRMLIDEQKRTDEALRRVMTMRNGDERVGLLNGMARSLAEAFDVMCVGFAMFRGEGECDERYAEVIAGWHRGEPIGALSYPLKGTPCGSVSAESFCIYPEEVCERFSEDRLLHDLGAESYAGVQIIGSNGESLGVLSIIHDAPLRAGYDYESVLSVFAGRAALEIERAALESELRDARDSAQRASDFKSSLLANVSHEIRTPLSAMIGYAELLAEGQMGASRVPEYASTVARNGNQLLGLVNDLLDSSKIEAGLMRVECIPASPAEICRDVTDVMMHKADAKSIALEIRCSSSIPTEVLVDPVRTRQILVNLVGNAVKFTAEGSVTLGVSYEHETLRFTVEDTGIGIPQSAVANLFEAFTQAEASTTRRFGGTGLGLSISRDLARLMCGDITVESEDGVGSTFTVTLHAPPAEGAEDLTKDDFFEACVGIGLASDPIGPQRPALHGVTVLLNEDSIDNRRLLAFHLRKLGAEVLEARDGEEGLELLSKHENIGLVITDLQMPVLDGYAFIERARASGCAVPIIALTAHATTEDESRCRALGCAGYETKPISRERLGEVCLDALGGRGRSRAA